MVTSNHVHLLVIDDGDRDVIPKSIQLIAGRTGQEYNQWTESIAVGSKAFIEATKGRLGTKAKGRRVLGQNGAYELREPELPYKTNFDSENAVLTSKNTYFWNDSI